MKRTLLLALSFVVLSVQTSARHGRRPSRASSIGALIPQNFRRRVWNPLVREVLGPNRRFTAHCLRHTWASIHLQSGTPITWITEQGGWAGSKVLLDTYGHPLRGETERFSDQLGVDDGPRRTQALQAPD